MKPRTCFFDGSTFVSPEFKQNGKPFQINGAIKQQWLDSLPKPKHLTLAEKIKAWFTPKPQATTTNRNLSSEDIAKTEEELDKLDREQEENDLREIEEEFIE